MAALYPLRALLCPITANTMNLFSSPSKFIPALAFLWRGKPFDSQLDEVWSHPPPRRA